MLLSQWRAIDFAASSSGTGKKGLQKTLLEKPQCFIEHTWWLAAMDNPSMGTGVKDEKGE